MLLGNVEVLLGNVEMLLREQGCVEVRGYEGAVGRAKERGGVVAGVREREH